MFSSDKPIKSKDNDLLNRTEFSKKLAKAILSYTEIDNFTISLCGKWGSGKTSILNMVIEEIGNLTENHDTNEKPIIVSFNPWNYSDQVQLTTQFFKTIMVSLGKKDNNKNLQKIGDALQNYAGILEYATYIPVAGSGIKLGKSLLDGAGKAVSKKAIANDSLENRKSVVWKALETQNQKIIIVIDDIDRLTNSQIRLIFQLVNSLAGFPNMIYLLSFDKEVVVRALSEEQKCNGEEYLEKIIQVPFEIPEANKALIDEVFCKRVADILFFNKNQDVTFDREHWQRVFPTCISPFLNTMRDVNRIINTFKFKYNLMKEEINATDLLAITTLQICAGEIYDWIYKKANLITGSLMSTQSISTVEQKENEAKYLNEFEIVYKKHPNLMLQVIRNLFPKFSWETGGYTHDQDDELTLRHKQRIASSDRINRYYNLSLEDIAIGKKQMTQTILHYNSEQLTEYFEELSKSNNLYNYLHELTAYVSEIPQNRKLMFIEELTKLRLIEENQKGTGFLTPTIESKASNCVYQIFKSNDKKENNVILQKLIDKASPTTLSYICEIIEYVERGYGRIGGFSNSEYEFIEEENLETMEKQILKKIKDLSKEFCLYDYEGIQEICILWNLLEKETLEQYTKSILEKDENIPKYLERVASYWHSSNGTDGWSFKESSFEDFISKDDAFSRISKLKNSRQFSELKFKFKQTAVAFSLWYQRDGYARAHITREEVDSLIPTWEYVGTEKNDKK